MAKIYIRLFSHSVNSWAGRGGGANFKHVARVLSLQGFNQNYSNLLKLLEFNYIPVYAVIRTDGKGS